MRMATFTVVILERVTYHVVVDAETEEDAREKAYDLFDDSGDRYFESSEAETERVINEDTGHATEYTQG